MRHNHLGGRRSQIIVPKPERKSFFRETKSPFSGYLLKTVLFFWVWWPLRVLDFVLAAESLTSWKSSAHQQLSNQDKILLTWSSRPWERKLIYQLHPNQLRWTMNSEWIEKWYLGRRSLSFGTVPFWSAVRQRERERVYSIINSIIMFHPGCFTKKGFQIGKPCTTWLSDGEIGILVMSPSPTPPKKGNQTTPQLSVPSCSLSARINIGFWWFLWKSCVVFSSGEATRLAASPASPLPWHHRPNLLGLHM